MSVLGLVGANYETFVSQQQTVNMYPEVTEQGGRNKGSLRPTPGLLEFASVGSGPIRGMDVMDGSLYVVSGNSLYSVTSEGEETYIAGITGTETVSMSHNLASQMLIVTGGAGYIYTVAAGVVEITDIDFPVGAQVGYYIDTYFVVNDPTGDQFWISNSGDGTNWLGSDFATAEGNPDRIVTLLPNHLDLFVFGEKSYEIWRNTGNTDFAFERQDGTFQERGCIAKHSVVPLDNTVYFLGDDKVVYRIDGYIPVRISDHGVEASLDALDCDGATAYSYTQNGHYFYVLNVGDLTWVYDATFSGQTQRPAWHKRKTGIGSGRWRVENYVNCYGKHLGGDRSAGKLWEMSLSTYTDNGSEIERIRVVPHIYDDVRPVTVDRCELRLKTGVGNSAVTDPQVWLEVSKDGGRTWGQRQLRSMGRVGEYETQIVWRRLGRGREWLFKFTSTDPCDQTWVEGYIDAIAGEG